MYHNNFYRRGANRVSNFKGLLGLFGDVNQAAKVKPDKPADYYRMNAPREVARRRRQIERGILRVTG
jgi:hypothetical protein